MSRALDSLQMKEEDALKFLVAGTHLSGPNLDFQIPALAYELKFLVAGTHLSGTNLDFPKGKMMTSIS